MLRLLDKQRLTILLSALDNAATNLDLEIKSMLDDYDSESDAYAELQDLREALAQVIKSFDDLPRP